MFYVLWSRTAQIRALNPLLVLFSFFTVYDLEHNKISAKFLKKAMVGFSPRDLGTGRFDEKLGDSWENQESWQVCVHVIITCRELLDLCCPQYYSCDLDFIFVLQLTFWSTLCLLNCKIVSFSCTYIMCCKYNSHVCLTLSFSGISAGFH